MQNLRKNHQALSELCRLASIAGFAVGAAWLAFFIVTQRWPMAATMLLLGLGVLPCWLVARRGRFSLGLMGAQVACIAFVIAFCLVFDLPSDSAPRTSHLFLLAIALVGYVNFQREHSKAQLALLGTALLAFVVLGCTSFSAPLAVPVSEEFHVLRAWANASLATFLLCAGMGVMHAEFINVARNAVELRFALTNQQFELFYQPQIEAGGEVVGAEALLRWKHPQRGYVSPAEFIPLAESCGVMPSLGDWVIDEACRTLARWQRQAQTRHLKLSINITADQFGQPHFVRQLLESTSKQGVPPASLKLELTESAFIADTESVIAKMHALQEAGFCISLDDFGTGYSSLSYLRRLPLAQLKIDRSFVHGVDDTPRAAAIAKNIVQMGCDLSLEVLAEGVETEAQLHVMQSYGCLVFQGFLFAKPMPCEQFEHYMASASG